MDAKQLRIGSCYEISSKKMKDYERTIFMDNIYLCMALNNEIAVKPIPLNEEWLIKFGFIRSSDKLLYLSIPAMSAEIHYEKQNYGNVIVLHSSLGVFVPDDVDYVHQLQNLHFAITNEELTIKLLKQQTHGKRIYGY